MFERQDSQTTWNSADVLAIEKRGYVIEEHSPECKLHFQKGI